MTRARRLTFILMATILLGTALFSASSAHKTSGNRVDSASAPTDAKPIVSERNLERSISKLLVGNVVTEAPAPFSPLLPQSPPAPETIATYAADCVTPKSAFIFGEIACAKLSGGPPLSIYPRKITWVDTDNNILQKEDVTTDPQTSLFAIPAVSTSTDYRGVWRVNDISAARSSVRTAAFFNVSNPAFPAADLSPTRDRTPRRVFSSPTPPRLILLSCPARLTTRTGIAPSRQRTAPAAPLLALFHHSPRAQARK